MISRREFLGQGPILLPLLFGIGGNPGVEIDKTLWPALFPFSILSGEPPLPIPTLQQIAGEETESIVERVYDYFEREQIELGHILAESDPQRLAALFCMVVIHLSHFYGNGGPLAQTWTEYLNRTLAECGSLAYYQSLLLNRFGLTWRHVIINDGSHGWIECQIGGAWEIFDSTVNVWLGQPAEALIAGGPRICRAFYTHWNDARRPEARQCIAGRAEPIYSTPGTLRSYMLGLGIFYHVPEDMLLIVRDG